MRARQQSNLGSKGADLVNGATVNAPALFEDGAGHRFFQNIFNLAVCDLARAFVGGFGFKIGF